MNWITELMDEYPTGRSDNAIQRLRAAFANEEKAVMDAAIMAYMRDGNEFFPKISTLSKYVSVARVDNNTWQVQWQAQLDEARATEDYTAVDDAIMQWEIARGELPVKE